MRAIVFGEPFELLEGNDWFGFAGIAPYKMPAISREKQFAEKLHAFSHGRETAENAGPPGAGSVEVAMSLRLRRCAVWFCLCWAAGELPRPRCLMDKRHRRSLSRQVWLTRVSVFAPEHIGGVNPRPWH